MLGVFVADVHVIVKDVPENVAVPELADAGVPVSLNVAQQVLKEYFRVTVVGVASPPIAAMHLLFVPSETPTVIPLPA